MLFLLLFGSLLLHSKFLSLLAVYRYIFFVLLRCVACLVRIHIRIHLILCASYIYCCAYFYSHARFISPNHFFLPSIHWNKNRTRLCSLFFHCHSYLCTYDLALRIVCKLRIVTSRHWRHNSHRFCSINYNRTAQYSTNHTTTRYNATDADDNPIVKSPELNMKSVDMCCALSNWMFLTQLTES